MIKNSIKIFTLFLILVLNLFLIKPVYAETVSEDNTYGWVSVGGISTNCSYDQNFKISLRFTGEKTGIVLEKDLSAASGFKDVIKLSYDTYKIELINSEYAENVVFENKLTVNSEAMNYNISLSNINNTTNTDGGTETVTDTVSDDDSLSYVLLKLLKNNIIFLIILGVCGGYLLYKEIQKRNQ